MEGRTKYALIVLVAAVIGCIAVFYWLWGSQRSEGDDWSSGSLSLGEKGDVSSDTAVGATQESLVVDVGGAVVNPGVYRLPSNSIVEDFIKVAGGFAEDADMEYVSRELNLAREIENHEKIYVPFIGEVGEVSEATDSSVARSSGGSDTLDGLVNLNSATLEQLDTLPGVGPATAQKIIDGRPYSKVEDIMNVSGIGESTYQKLKDLIKI